MLHKARLTERAVGALTEAVAGGLALLCRARAQACAIPLIHVAETMRPLPIVPMATAPFFISGVALVRGEPTPVVDLGALLGATEPPSFTRFVTVRAQGRIVALALDEVLHVREITSESLAALPPLLNAADASVVSAVAALDSGLLFVLEGARAVPEGFWLAFDEGRP